MLAWERRHLFAGTWTCLGRVAELLEPPVKQRALVVGDVPALLVQDGDAVRMFANTCRHRGHELLAEGDTSSRRQVVCPYHAWSYKTSRRRWSRRRASRTCRASTRPRRASSSCRSRCGRAGSSATRCTRSGAPRCRRSTTHLGELRRIVAPYAPGSLSLAGRHTYEIAANWKVVAENYHECYHCPMIHPELCQVTPPDSR